MKFIWNFLRGGVLIKIPSVGGGIQIFYETAQSHSYLIKSHYNQQLSFPGKFKYWRHPLHPSPCAHKFTTSYCKIWFVLLCTIISGVHSICNFTIACSFAQIPQFCLAHPCCAEFSRDQHTHKQNGRFFSIRLGL